MNDNKKFNLSVFISMFAKNMIEVFIPIILYKTRFSIDQIFIYMMFQYLLSVIVIYFIPKINKLFKIKGLIIISTIFFIATYWFIFSMNKTIISLFLLALFYTLHTSIYWILRHLYIVELYPVNKMSNSVGNVLIASEIAFLFASYLGALILDKSNNLILIIISSILLLISNYILLKINIKDPSTKIDLKILKEIPKKNIIFFILEQFKVLGIFIFPLYLTIFLKTNYKFIGVFNILISLSSIIFIFLFSRLISKRKKSYLFITTLFYSTLWILKINVSIKIIILIVAFLEGITSKIYQTSVTRFLYALGKKYDAFNYVNVAEMLFNLVRFIIILIVFIFIKDLKIFLYICTVGLFLTGIVKFNDLND